jgi:hypothetical protein
MRNFTRPLLALALLAAAGAQADTRETQRKHLEAFTPYLGAPVDEFTFWSLYKWQLVAPDKVVVWPTINEAYLITVEEPCPKLEWAGSIGLTSQQSRRISRRFDYVTMAGDRCHIAEIRPVDLKRMKADGRADGA